MRKFRMAAAGIAMLATGVAGAAAQDFSQVIAARQGQFAIMEYNLRVLEEMVAGERPYDAEIAGNRAENIHAATRLNQDLNWLPGSDQPGVPRTRATGVRADVKTFKASFAGMMGGADALLAASGRGAREMAPAVRSMRATCRSCHQFYRPAK